MKPAALAETAGKNKIKCKQSTSIRRTNFHRKNQEPRKQPKQPQKPAGTKPQEAVETF